MTRKLPADIPSPELRGAHRPDDPEATPAPPPNDGSKRIYEKLSLFKRTSRPIP
jgi:hypothetical protein